MKRQTVLAQRGCQCRGTQVQLKNVRLDSPAAAKLYAQAVLGRLMPMNKAAGITDAERALISPWFDAGARTDSDQSPASVQ